MTGYPKGGLIGILRGVTSESIVPVCETVAAAGLEVVEVPLNSPDPLEAIARARAALGESVLVGAGTVTTIAQVRDVAAAGAQFVVSPVCDPAVIEATVLAGLGSYPGVATPTEALTALACGATALKVFPAVQVGIPGLRAWKAILPEGTGVLPVGGVMPADFAAWTAAGATGFGMGSELFAPRYSLADISSRATGIAAAWSALGGVR